MVRQGEQMTMKPGDRVVVRMMRGRKYGRVVDECKDRVHWSVIIDGNLSATRVMWKRLTLLKPEQLAFHWRK